MQQITNGMAASRLQGVIWLKSRHSNPSGSCVEWAELADGGIAVRNSRHPAGPALIYTRAEMAAFVHGAKDGELDDVVGRPQGGGMADPGDRAAQGATGCDGLYSTAPKMG